MSLAAEPWLGNPVRTCVAREEGGVCRDFDSRFEIAATPAAGLVWCAIEWDRIPAGEAQGALVPGVKVRSAIPGLGQRSFAFLSSSLSLRGFARMDLYHIWCDLKAGVGDVEFCQRVDAFLGKLRDEGAISGHRISRRKLGFGPALLGEFHIQVEIRDLAQLDAAFGRAATRAEPVESLHQAVNSVATNLSFALYRDFPDATRVRGQEKF